jgi:hypothetical protein
MLIAVRQTSKIFNQGQNVKEIILHNWKKMPIQAAERQFAATPPVSSELTGKEGLGGSP